LACAVYSDKAATDANFEKITQLLLENHEYLYSAIGSHNVRSQARAIAIAELSKFPAVALKCSPLRYGR
jgi:RHH-type proline utilization regulon transcriptional repressor/proline dehydrogenase/delta 1-pyrroline-5-carboxylate dehydrogenase